MEIKLLLSLMFLSGCSFNEDSSCHYYGNNLFTSGSLIYVDHKVLCKPVVCFMPVVNRSVQFECCVINIASWPYSKPLYCLFFFLKRERKHCEWKLSAGLVSARKTFWYWVSNCKSNLIYSHKLFFLFLCRHL